MTKEYLERCIGREFTHFKGNRYRVEGFAKDSETLETMVVYRALYGDYGLWTRSAEMFFETVERDGCTFPRFRLEPTTTHIIGKIVSGGQTGVDRGALEAAYDLGFPYGGLIPKGRMAEDGIVPEKFKMEVSYKKDYLFRTEWNVTHSDATLILSNPNRDPGSAEPKLTGGTLKTERFCQTHGKPYLVLFSGNVAKALEWLRSLNKRDIVMNVAGPRESKSPGIQAKTKAFIMKILEANQGM